MGAQLGGASGPKHDKRFIQMNEVRRRASDWVQRRTPRFASMIDDEPGHPTGHRAIPKGRPPC
jgi:hypothetical protein